jgi:CubicO group peptidase (beta-lactamase class C family)
MKKLLTVCYLFATFQLYGQKKSFDEVLSFFHSEKNFTGAVLVATNGHIDYVNAVGLANSESGQKMNVTSTFKIASITKTFTTVLILQLVQEGKIDLNATIGTYFPTYQGEGKDKVSIKNLLTYSSGISNDAEPLGMKSYQTFLTLDEYITQYCSGKLIESPGLKSSYSNTEFIILSKIIENVTKKSFKKVLQERILTPLKMKNTGVFENSNEVKGLVKSYTVDDSTHHRKVDEPYFVQNFYGAGAMYSTVLDLLKFDVAIFNHQLLKPETTALMLKPNSALNDVTFGFWYSAGWGIFNNQFVYRPGGILGSTSNWIHTLDDKKSIIVFSNTNGSNLYELSEQLYLVSKGEKASIVKKDK